MALLSQRASTRSIPEYLPHTFVQLRLALPENVCRVSVSTCAPCQPLLPKGALVGPGRPPRTLAVPAGVGAQNHRRLACVPSGPTDEGHLRTPRAPPRTFRRHVSGVGTLACARPSMPCLTCGTGDVRRAAVILFE